MFCLAKWCNLKETGIQRLLLCFNYTCTSKQLISLLKYMPPKFNSCKALVYYFYYIIFDAIFRWIIFFLKKYNQIMKTCMGNVHKSILWISLFCMNFTQVQLYLKAIHVCFPKDKEDMQIIHEWTTRLLINTQSHTSRVVECISFHWISVRILECTRAGFLLQK